MSGIEAAFFGSLARDAELKTSKAGRSYLRLNVRIGEGDCSQWLNVMAFDEKAIEQGDKLIRGAKVYIEGGGLKIDEWIGSDGAKRHGLSCMSWHCRLSEIGRNRPKRDQNGDPNRSPRPVNEFHNDEIGF